MNWRQLLKTDLGALLWGLPEKERPEKPKRPPRLQGPRYLVRKGRRWRDLRLLADHLVALTEANVPLAAGLDAASRDAPSFVFKAVLFNLSYDLDSGRTLAQSMRRNPRFFPDFYADMVEIGEETGHLAESLKALRDIVVETTDFRYRVRAYASYIGMVWLALMALLALIGAYVIPLFSDILREFGATPPATFVLWSQLMDVSQPVLHLMPHALREAGPKVVFPALMVSFVLAFMVLWSSYSTLMRRSAAMRRLAIRLLCHMPGLRHVVSKRILAHIAYALERLLSARVPLDKALEMVASLGISSIFAEPLQRVASKVQQGHSLKAALDGEPVFLPSFRGFVSVGETSGLLNEALLRIAELYRRQVRRTERVLLDVLSPVAIVAAGGIVLITFSTMFMILQSMADSLAVP